MPREKQTVALCMIVKDEAKVITRCLDSVRALVNYYCICDTGSSDGTIQIVEKYLSDNSLEGKVHSHIWKNFAHNRNLAFEAGKGKCDYIMTIDADEVIVPLVDGQPQLDQKVKRLPSFKGRDRIDIKTHLGNCVYSRFQFFKDGLNWKWTYPVHEVCGCDDSHSSMLIDNICNVPRTDGARSVDPNKYLRDALQFETFLLDHPKDARAWFYLAQSYRDGGQLQKALAAIEEALKHSVWDEERYMLRLRKARYSLQAGAPESLVVGYLLEAFNERPTRHEALGSLLSLYRQKDKFNAGILIGEKLLEMQGPTRDILFVEKDFKDYRIKDDLSICYYWTGAYAKSLALTTDLLKNKFVPPDQKARILKNHEFSQAKVAEAKSKLAASLKS